MREYGAGDGQIVFPRRSMMDQQETLAPTPEKMRKLESIYQNYGSQNSVMILLQQIQSSLGFIPEFAIRFLSRKTRISESHIFGVVTFYSQFSMVPMGKNIIKICNGTACHVGGSKFLSKKLRKLLKVTDEHPTTRDLLFTVQNVACLGCCALAPAMMVNNKVYGSLTEDKIKQVIDTYRVSAEQKVN
jgi:NADH-quinone oxidoreductase subunit E